MSAEIEQVRAALSQFKTAPDLETMRRLYDEDGARFYVEGDASRESVTVAGCDAEWQRSGCGSDVTVYYLHGGGYSIGSLTSHRHLAQAFARVTGGSSFAIDYRLIPEHPLPAQVEDALAGYRYLLESGVAPGRIAVAGDSAGGNLVMALLLALKREGLPLPACAVCLSPWVDYEANSASMYSKGDLDPVISREASLMQAQLYLADVGPEHEAAAILTADLSGLPPMLIQVGSHEVLLDDSVQLAARAGAADVEVRLEIWPEMVHVWPFYHPILKEGRAAIESAGQFIRAHTGG